MSDEKRPYTVYRSRRRFWRRDPTASKLSKGNAPAPPPEPERAEPAAARSAPNPAPTEVRPRVQRLKDPAGKKQRLPRLRGREKAAPAPQRAPVARRHQPPMRRRPRLRPFRLLRWIIVAPILWVLLSAVLFMVSAQINRGQLKDAVGPVLAANSFPLVTPNTILVLGSDARTDGLAEPGSGGPGRSDTIMLLRIGGGANASLSIPRDTVAEIPGSGTNKINAAYAIGGAALATKTVKRFLDIEIDHVVEVSFDDFPALVDALGGITYEGGPVLSRINGGDSNGGYTLRLPRGKTEINGRQALALARTRTNLRAPNETDLDRARRQQQLVAAMKKKIISAETFVRLPWVSWAAPKAVRSDMSGPTLLAVAAASTTGGDAKPVVLKPSGAATLSDGGAGLTVDDPTKRSAVRRFLSG